MFIYKFLKERNIKSVAMEKQSFAFGERSLSDVVLIVGNHEFHVHKVVNSVVFDSSLL